ncbi:hypothetical protein ACIA8C_05845 [Nocardia sp. NPDC051321]|uniref:hypothetical protein n=1 Tax=Nocardia sp. NPDC051321 TaxID=3364323 RepID=UPI00379BCEEE
MGKHSAPRNNVVPARLAMLSTATLIGLAVSANGAAGQAIADDTNSAATSGDGGWVAPSKKAVLTAVPATYQQQSRPHPVAAKRPAHRADRPTVRPGGNAKPGMGAQPGGAAKPGTGAPLAAIVDSLATGSAALPAPLRTVLEDLVKQVGPVLAKGLIEMIANGNPQSPKTRHAAPAPAAPAASVAGDDAGDAVDGGFDAADDGADVGAADDDGSAAAADDDGANFGAAGDDSDFDVAEDDTADFAAADDDGAAFGAAGEDSDFDAAEDDGANFGAAADDITADLPDDDADWAPLALGPSTVG